MAKKPMISNSQAQKAFFVIAAFAVAVWLASAGGFITLASTPAPSGPQNQVTGGAANTSAYGGLALSTTTQSLQNKSTNFDKPGTAVSVTAVTVFTNPTLGLLNPGGLTVSTIGGTQYTALATATSFFGNVQTITSPNPFVSFSQKAVDTAISKTAYLNDISTKITGDQNLTIGAGGSATAVVALRQSAINTHLSGDIGKFCVYVNVTNGQQGNYNPNPNFMYASFKGSPCVSYTGGNTGLSNAQTPTTATNGVAGTLLTAFVCSGDYSAASDSDTHYLNIVYAANTGVNPGAQNATGVNVVGADYYLNTISGALEKGCVKDDGSVIQSIQTISVPVD